MCCVQFGLTIPLAGFLIYTCLKTLQSQRNFMSEKTFRLHKQLILSLVLQLIVPFSTLFIPFTLMAALVFFEVSNITCKLLDFLELFWYTIISGIHQGLMLVGTIHSFCNTLMMAIMIKPYRNTVISYVLGKKLRDSRFSETHVMPGAVFPA